MKNFKSWQWIITSNKTSLILALIIVILLFGLTYFSTKTIQNEKEISSNIEKIKTTLQNDLLPENYISPTPIISPSLESKNINQKSKATNSIKKPPTKSDTVLPEKMAETAEGRDKDREIILSQISNFISEYNFKFDKLPELYSDKNETLLSTKESNSIYFYNEKENKINALGMNFPPETYSLKLINSCESNFSQKSFLNFSYDKNTSKISLCKENQKVEEFIVF